MSSSEEVVKNDAETLVKIVSKLLDKAGKDPRLTPRLLREKAEQRMSLPKGDLKSQREKIKDIIWDWWEKQKTAQIDREAAILKSLLKLARVSGNVPSVMKGIKDMPTMNEQIVALRERLRAKGLVFSDFPTEAETAAAEKAYQLKQDLDGIDPSLIVNSSRKRAASEGPADAVAAAVVVKTEKVAATGGSSSSYRTVDAITTVGSYKTDPSGTADGTAAVVVKIGQGGEGASGADMKAGAASSTAGVAGAVAKRPRIEYSDEEAEF